MINIKKERVRQGLSHAELGELVGVKRLAIINYETGKRIPAADVYEAIIIALGGTIAVTFPTDKEVKEVIEAVKIAPLVMPVDMVSTAVEIGLKEFNPDKWKQRKPVELLTQRDGATKLLKAIDSPKKK